MLAIFAVVVVAVAGCAGAVYVLNDDDKDGDKFSMVSGLPVFGNADGNGVIDSSDLAIVKDVKDGKKTLEEYPYADANQDGEVNDADVELVQKIINKESCTIYHVNTCSTGNYVASTAWPVKSAVSTGAANMLMLLTLAGVKDMVHGITYSASSSPDPALFPTFSKMKSLGSSSTKMTTDAVGDIQKTYNVTALISDKTASTISNESDFEAQNIDVIRVDAAYVDVEKFTTQIILIGFLFGTETQALSVAEWELETMKEINDKVATIENKVSAITTNGSTAKGAWVSAGTSDYLDVIKAAGGNYAIGDGDFPSTYASGAYFVTGDTWLYKCDFDYIVSIRTGGWYSGMTQEEITKKYDDTMEYLTATEAYQNHNAYVIVGDAPVILRVAYAACVMYPEIFSTEWADDLNKEFFEKFYDVDIDFTGKTFVISYNDAHPSS